jgi:hypothetical protein
MARLTRGDELRKRLEELNALNVWTQLDSHEEMDSRDSEVEVSVSARAA